MIAIKKVQVVPLDENYGKIIDSFTTTDDKTKNAPSLRITEAIKNNVDQNITDIENLENTVFVKSNIATLTTTVTVENGNGQNSSIINLPTGFTKDNSFVIGYKFSSSDSSFEDESNQRLVNMGSGYISINPEIKYWTTSKLYVGFSQSTTHATTTYTITILLLKTS